QRSAAAGAARARPLRRRSHPGRLHRPGDGHLPGGGERRALRRHRPGRAARHRRRARPGGGRMSADPSAMPAPARDPYLDLALDGVHAIEASAGTGKTYTLATLVVRLVVERGLRVGQVLAVTFTEAATQELRSRIRARLLLAGELVGMPPASDEAPEAALTRNVLDAHLAQGTETAEALRRRLHAAANDIDLAAIFTIHGFCARVLREHALEAGQALACDLPLLVRERTLRPTLAELPDDPAPRLHASGEALAAAFRAHGDDFRASLVSAVEGKVLHGGSYKLDWINVLFDALHQWC